MGEYGGEESVFMATTSCDSRLPLSPSRPPLQLPQAQDPAVQRSILSSVRLVFRIFFSLNGPGLTPVRGEGGEGRRGGGAGERGTCVGDEMNASEGGRKGGFQVRGAAVGLATGKKVMQNDMDMEKAENGGMVLGGPCSVAGVWDRCGVSSCLDVMCHVMWVGCVARHTA